MLAFKLEKRDREHYLPRPEQLKVNIAFLLTSEKCESAKAVADGFKERFPRAACIATEFDKIHSEVKEWAERNPKDFENVYHQTIWRHIYSLSPTVVV